MKILSVSSVCFVGALILALFVTWSATAPQQINGNREVAGCADKCDDIHNASCSPIDPKRPCSAVHIICIGDGGKDCFRINASCFGENCKRDWGWACI